MFTLELRFLDLKLQAIEDTIDLALHVLFPCGST